MREKKMFDHQGQVSWSGLPDKLKHFGGDNYPYVFDELNPPTSIPGIPQEILEDLLYYSVAKTFENRLLGEVERFCSFLRTSPDGQEFMKQEKVRGRLAGYFFFCIYTSSNLNAAISAYREAFETKNAFDYEHEVMDSKWLVPMSGNLMCDLHCNYIAKIFSKATPDETIQFLSDIGKLIAESALGMAMDRFCEISTLLPSLRDKDDYIEFLSGFKDNNKPSPFKGETNRETAMIAAIHLSKSYPGWEKLFSYRIPFQMDCNTPFAYRPEEGVLDSRIKITKDSWNGINIRGCLPLGPMRDGSKRAELQTDEEQALAAASTFAKIFAMERQDLLRERQRIQKKEHQEKKEKKLAMSLEKEVSRLQKVLEEIQSDSLRKNEDEVKRKDAELNRLRQMLLVQKENLAKKNREIESIRKAFEAERIQREALESEIEALQAIASQIDFKDQTKKDAETLDTSVFNELRIVSFGGHPAWIKGMRRLHPNITFYSGESMPSEVIASADMVWMQTNAIDHKTFYRLINEIRAKNVPLRYFTFAGHVACKKQMVEETKAYIQEK